MSSLTRNAVTLAAALLALAGIGLSLWRADWRYSLPTPRPAELVQPDCVEPALLARLRAAAGSSASAEPLLIHFGNPDCPCTRFNREHVLELAAACRGCIAELALSELPEQEPAGSVSFDEDLALPALAENDGQIARALGVYSTPQAVLIDGAGRIFYRGNYNQSRYCKRPESAYVALAIAALRAGRACPQFPPEALRAYGCELPNRAWEKRLP
jgi:hypothetical protein